MKEILKISYRTFLFCLLVSTAIYLIRSETHADVLRLRMDAKDDGLGPKAENFKLCATRGRIIVGTLIIRGDNAPAEAAVGNTASTYRVGHAYRPTASIYIRDGTAFDYFGFGFGSGTTDSTNGWASPGSPNYVVTETFFIIPLWTLFALPALLLLHSVLRRYQIKRESFRMIVAS